MSSLIVKTAICWNNLLELNVHLYSLGFWKLWVEMAILEAFAFRWIMELIVIGSLGSCLVSSG